VTHELAHNLGADHDGDRDNRELTIFFEKNYNILAFLDIFLVFSIIFPQIIYMQITSFNKRLLICSSLSYRVKYSKTDKKFKFGFNSHTTLEIIDLFSF